MGREWFTTTIGEQATLQRGIDITKADQRDGRVPVISSGGVSSHHDLPAANGPGVVLGRKGVVGSVWFVTSDYWPHDTTLWVKDFHGNDRRFVYYFFKWMAPRLATMDVGSANPTLNRNHVHPIEVRWPPFVEQLAIAHILGTLDDKIELNRRMSETLEAMARALFKSWFVDFDPVRAKAEGRDPGLPKALADLFPARLVDSEYSELGEIPEGWEVKSLDQVARFLNGLALQKYPPTGDRSLPVIKIAQLRSGRTDGADRATADLDSDYIIADGDILFSWSGSLECVLWAGGPGALNQHLFKVTSSNYPRWLCYFAVHQHLEDFRHIAAGKATTMGHIQRHHLSDAKIVVPPAPVPGEIDQHIAPLFESLWKRQVESRTLGSLRDVLLPKLISGELRVKDAERFASAVSV
jgi:type I restriction enzyme S subunit